MAGKCLALARSAWQDVSFILLSKMILDIPETLFQKILYLAGFNWE